MEILLQTYPVILHIVVLLAATLQAASGIGFGLVSGPLILIAMNSPAAMQVAIILSTVVAGLLAPPLFKKVERPLLARLLLGTVVGLPLGMLLLSVLDIKLLKLGAASLISINLCFMLGWLRLGKHHNPRADLATGIVSGVLAATLAMPGPPVNAHLSALGRSKDVVRAVTLVMFLVSNPWAYAAHAWTVGWSMPALALSWQLLPVTLTGVLCGHLLARHMSEQLFRRVGITVMALTATSLLASIFI